MKTLVILDGYAELIPIGPFDEELKLMPKYKNSRTGEEGSLQEISDRDKVFWETPWIGTGHLAIRSKTGGPVKTGIRKKKALKYLVELTG